MRCAYVHFSRSDDAERFITRKDVAETSVDRAELVDPDRSGHKSI